MPEKTRDFNLYGGLKLTAFDKSTLQEFTFGAIPMRLFRFKDKVTLVIEVWEELGEFDAGLPTSSKFNKSFTIPLAEALEDYGQFFEPMTAAVFDWLEVAPDAYDLEMLDISLTNLKIRASAVHKTNKGKTVQDETDSLEEFEQIKADYPEMVQAYFQFAWYYSKTHDANLAKFN